MPNLQKLLPRERCKQCLFFFLQKSRHHFTKVHPGKPVSLLGFLAEHRQGFSSENVSGVSLLSRSQLENLYPAGMRASPKPYRWSFLSLHSIDSSAIHGPRAVKGELHSVCSICRILRWGSCDPSHSFLRRCKLSQAQLNNLFFFFFGKEMQLNSLDCGCLAWKSTAYITKQHVIKFDTVIRFAGLLGWCGWYIVAFIF